MSRIAPQMDMFMARRGYVRARTLKALFRWNATSTVTRWVRIEILPTKATVTAGGIQWVLWKTARNRFTNADLYELPATAEAALIESRNIETEVQT